jgi:hypothetical protein
MRNCLLRRGRGVLHRARGRRRAQIDSTPIRVPTRTRLDGQVVHALVKARLPVGIGWADLLPCGPFQARRRRGARLAAAGAPAVGRTPSWAASPPRTIDLGGWRSSGAALSLLHWPQPPVGAAQRSGGGSSICRRDHPRRRGRCPGRRLAARLGVCPLSPARAAVSTLAELDAAAPAAIVHLARPGHTARVNSAGLSGPYHARHRSARRTHRGDPDGEPNGILHETAMLPFSHAVAHEFTTLPLDDSEYDRKGAILHRPRPHHQL